MEVLGWFVLVVLVLMGLGVVGRKLYLWWHGPE